MDLLKAAIGEDVADVLQSIEDKLYETGLLVSATRDTKAEVTIALRKVAIGAGEVVALVVQVATSQPLEKAHRNWEPIRQFVVGKYATLQCALPEELREFLLDCPGPLLFVNGVMVA